MNKFRIYLTMLAAAAIFSCSESGKSVTPQLQSFSVILNKNSALVVKVKFSLSVDSKAHVKYWQASESESSAKLSALSDSKINHTVSLYQLREKTAYNYKVVVLDASGNESETSQIQTFTTEAMPAWLNTYYKTAENTIQETLPGYYFVVPSAKPNGLLLINNSGKIAWYWSPPSNYIVKTARMTAKNSVLMLLDENATPFGDGNILLETNLAGDTLSYFRMGEKGFDKSIHHDLQMDSKGNIVAITNTFSNNLPGDGIIVLDSQGKKIWEWSTFSELTNIDPTNYAQPWGNSLVIDKDNNYIVSLRSLSQVWKINSSTGKVMWKLGKNGTIKMPETSNFLFQHFAHRNANDEIMLFDNGSAARPETRLLSFNLNETTLEATPKINISLPQNLYSMIMGSTSLLPDGNLLTVSAVNGKILKMTKTGQILWTISASQPIYRAEYLANPFETE
ncbi:aryl-sulfate sulfotransferase [Dyadobacter psychrotolerans]|uniref:Fibronectin type-III domain-containing protein n=1 Tax=Dyadobacter psychrotolerans TaxID=2541721 RepID=A0A4R5DVT5_9BACT|nr:aryl-sulfate sulfotransferase [Dyadobacter psychrotolerans]TDE16480.1 hypothetical protein E0F88_09595 [Dyadobacter psychrotolerans]